MEEGQLQKDYSVLEEGHQEFKAEVQNNWPMMDQVIPCPECDSMHSSHEAVVAHSVDVHRWGERSKTTMEKLKLNDVSDPRSMLKWLIEEEYKGLKSEEAPSALLVPKVEDEEINLELTIGRENIGLFDNLDEVTDILNYILTNEVEDEET